MINITGNNEIPNHTQSSFSKLFFLWISDNNIPNIKNFIDDETNGEKVMSLLDEKNMTVLHKAAFLDLQEILFLILNKLNSNISISKQKIKRFVNSKEINGNTALHYASYRGNLNMIKVLIINGAFYDDLNANGSSVLHMASQGDQPGILIYFREKYNMDILAKDYQGSTCVHWACFTAAINSLNFLLSWINSEEINIRDNQGRTPLHIAIFSERTKIIKKLICKGANVEAKDKNGHTAYELAKINGVYNMAELIQIHSNHGICCYKNNKFLIRREKSMFNIIIFIMLHLFVVFVSLFIFFPFINNSLLEYAYITLLIILFALFSVLVVGDPGYISKAEEKSLLYLIEEEHVKINEYCPYCKIHLELYTKHCFYCNRCVDEFDHHCIWVNNCIGSKNSFKFTLFLFATVLNLIFNYVVAYKAYFTLNFEEEYNQLDIALKPSKFVFQILCITIMTLCVCFILPVCYLMTLNVRNSFTNKVKEKGNYTKLK